MVLSNIEHGNHSLTVVALSNGGDHSLTVVARTESWLVFAG
jgi:hypothetical protein